MNDKESKILYEVLDWLNKKKIESSITQKENF